MWLGATLAAAPACGSFSIAPSAPAADAGVRADVDASPSGDAAADAPDGVAAERVRTVPVASFRVTATEVTHAQYAEFLAAVDQAPPMQPPECGWNDSFAPSPPCVLDPVKTPNRPVACVDWCDARAFCEWAGLRLCGKIDGGPASFADVKNHGTDQWFRACAGPENHRYPYGGVLNEGACTFGGGEPSDVATHPGCQGGYPGLFDMAGNVGEWEDACEPSGGGAAEDRCLVRGGYFAYNAEDVDCALFDPYTRRKSSDKIGIRCCSR
jgi:formylglycine-generating enzyme required for sulfatase activity